MTKGFLLEETLKNNRPGIPLTLCFKEFVLIVVNASMPLLFYK